MDQLVDLNLTDITPDPNQPRKDFEPNSLQELAESIRAQGVLQPIKVRRNPNSGHDQPKYMLVFGERRWRASKIAGKTTIPSIVIALDLSDQQLYGNQLSENLHKEQLNPVEKAEFLDGRLQYLRDSGIDKPLQALANELGVSVSWVSKNTAVLKYPENIRALARDGLIRDYSLLRRISKLDDEQQPHVISLIQSGDFNSKAYFAPKPKKAQKTISHAKLPQFTLRFTQQELLSLMGKLNFDQIPASISDDNKKQVLKDFKAWVLS